MIRSSERHQVEKDLALRPDAERGSIGEAETNLGMSIDAQRFASRYDQIPAGTELAGLSASMQAILSCGAAMRTAMLRPGAACRGASDGQQRAPAERFSLRTISTAARVP